MIVVNEDPDRRLGVEVSGLAALEGRELHLLYGDETATVDRGTIVTRMQGHEVKVFCTDPSVVADKQEGREYGF